MDLEQRAWMFSETNALSAFLEGRMADLLTASHFLQTMVVGVGRVVASASIVGRLTQHSGLSKPNKPTLACLKLACSLKLDKLDEKRYCK